MIRRALAVAFLVLLASGDARAAGYRAGVQRGNKVRRGMCSTGGGCASGISTLLKAWWDPEDEGSLTHASNAVSDWLDQTGTYTVSQATAGAKPTRVASGGAPLNGRQHVDFDGGDSLSWAGLIATGQAGEVWSVFDRDTSGTSQAVYEQTGSGVVGYGVTYACQTPAVARPGFAFYSVTTNNIARTTNNYANGISVVYRLSSTATDYVLECNGVDETIAFVTGSDNGLWYGDETQTSSTVGAHLASGVASQWMDGQVGDVLVFDGANLSSVEAYCVRVYLAKKYGVALP